jgi:acyl-CoA thioester hydrolase
MPAVFEYTHTVTENDLDQLGHANNISYLKWMQTAAVEHSAAQGWPSEAYITLGCGWVVRSHFIEYLAPAVLGDSLVIKTWVADIGKVTSRRRFHILHATTQRLLAKAETNWAFVTYQTGAPTRIPTQVAEAFEVVTEA